MSQHLESMVAEPFLEGRRKLRDIRTDENASDALTSSSPRTKEQARSLRKVKPSEADVAL
jgi:hypothetical protein